jgi:hypothetical protein
MRHSKGNKERMIHKCIKNTVITEIAVTGWAKIGSMARAQLGYAISMDEFIVLQYFYYVFFHTINPIILVDSHAWFNLAKFLCHCFCFKTKLIFIRKFFLNSFSSCKSNTLQITKLGEMADTYYNYDRWNFWDALKQL